MKSRNLWLLGIVFLLISALAVLHESDYRSLQRRIAVLEGAK